MKCTVETLKKELLNFPTMVKDPTSNEQDVITWHWNFLQKFKAFTKELEDKLVYPTHTKNIAVYDFIKEILGDIQK